MLATVLLFTRCTVRLRYRPTAADPRGRKQYLESGLGRVQGRTAFQTENCVNCLLQPHKTSILSRRKKKRSQMQYPVDCIILIMFFPFAETPSGSLPHPATHGGIPLDSRRCPPNDFQHGRTPRTGRLGRHPPEEAARPCTSSGRGRPFCGSSCALRSDWRRGGGGTSDGLCFADSTETPSRTRSARRGGASLPRPVTSARLWLELPRNLLRTADSMGALSVTAQSRTRSGSMRSLSRVVNGYHCCRSPRSRREPSS